MSIMHGQSKFRVDVTLVNKCNENLVLFVCRWYLVAKQQRTNKRAKFA
jgi:hypothetical protein